MAAVVIIDDEHGLSVEACHINQPNKCKLLLYKSFPFKQLYTCYKMERLSYKGGCIVHSHMRIKVFKRRVDLHLGYR